MSRYYPAGTGELDPDAPWNQDAIEDAPEPTDTDWTDAQELRAWWRFSAALGQGGER